MTDEQVKKFLKSSEFLQESAPPRIQWRLIIGCIVILNILVALTIGGIV